MYNFRVQIIRIPKPQESQRISIRFIDSNHEKGIFYVNRKTSLVPAKVNQCRRTVGYNLAQFQVNRSTSEYIQRAWLNHRTHSSVWLFRSLFVSPHGVEGSSKSFQDSLAQLLFNNWLYNTEHCIPFAVYFYSFHTYVTSFRHFTLHLLCMWNIFSSLMMPLIVESLDFGFYLF